MPSGTSGRESCCGWKKLAPHLPVASRESTHEKDEENYCSLFSSGLWFIGFSLEARV